LSFFFDFASLTSQMCTPRYCVEFNQAVERLRAVERQLDAQLEAGPQSTKSLIGLFLLFLLVSFVALMAHAAAEHSAAARTHG
jgi:hypothetical protein